ncbi:16S rRNA (uracil(1498)-N(3))-methyltransferase [Brunnivagina elsteri]|uniref:Ribosomal RNA small subunit methyltransferase E n=1 Tax=Brunnivagina elsteri CCALA 953 TaxID=987040 RepID=A0A2A2TKL2_9CYAN|nr:16S rRNA (uracil(1498)-N(3))-methyltransferase [Calothrix elsteri]PAX55210.1 16S rRNA (uracil(1498)-N(3))-methyltransferase [Calothrix elsteri CCALA 953]
MSQLQRIVVSPSQLQDNQISLTPEQLHYLVRVLRSYDGDKFIAIDGTGKWWLTKLQGEFGIVLELLEVQTELPISVTLLLALPKGNGFDDVVRACTELGVANIVPVLSDRTLLNPSPQKLERWRRIAIEATEQSERTIIPTILEPMTFKAALSALTAEQKYICEGRNNNPHLLSYLQNQKQITNNQIIIAIGPEGGWTDTELQLATETGYQPVSLGKRILRAITAPTVALSLISALHEV